LGRRRSFAEVEFHNTGLYNLKGKFSYPPPNLGLYEFTHQEEDIGKFKAPTLRNIAVIVPYMHDGSIKTLEAAASRPTPSPLATMPGVFVMIGRAADSAALETCPAQRSDRAESGFALFARPPPSL